MRRALVAPLALALLLASTASAQPRDHLRLDELAAELRGNPQALEALDALLADMGTRPGAGAMLTPGQRAQLRETLLNALRTGDVAALERAPALTVGEMGLAMNVATAAHGARATVGGQAASADATTGVGHPPASARAQREPLGLPVGAASSQATPGPTAPTAPTTPAAPAGPAAALGALGIAPRKVLDPDLVTREADSARMADVLNRLAVNPTARPLLFITEAGREAATPADLLRLLQETGHTVRVEDVRTFADFAGLTASGRDLAAPMWADTELAVPGRGTLKVPVTHSQHELVVRGPRVNVDVSFYMGIDGDAKFRAMTGKRAAWTGRRVAHAYDDDRAVEAIRVAGEVRRSFEANRAAHPELPYGGYYTLGVCNDSNAFVEHAMTGRTTLYPLTRDLRFYQGPGEIDRIARAMPNDGRGQPADLDRVLASLPVDDPLGDPDALAFPALRDDLRALAAARAARGQQAQPSTQQGGAPQPGLTDELERVGPR